MIKTKRLYAHYGYLSLMVTFYIILFRFATNFLFDDRPLMASALGIVGALVGRIVMFNAIKGWPRRASLQERVVLTADGWKKDELT